MVADLHDIADASSRLRLNPYACPNPPVKRVFAFYDFGYVIGLF